jgi:phosphoglycerate dehydrogenase-like enzyme
VFESADRLKVVARTGAGYDAIDLKAADEKGIVITTSPGINHRTVAEYVFALILAVARRLLENLTEVPKGRWKKHLGRDLAGSTLGIVGMGAIGKEVAKRARAFEMRVVACDSIRDETFATQYQVTYVPLETLLQESDFVTLNLCLDEKSRHMINAERLSLMKPTAYLINDSRGGVIDTQALYHALKEKRIAGAALDVFEEEPLGDSPLRELDNVYLSPHAAGSTEATHNAQGLAAAENVIRVLRGEPPLNAIAGFHRRCGRSAAKLRLGRRYKPTIVC